MNLEEMTVEARQGVRLYELKAISYYSRPDWPVQGKSHDFYHQTLQEGLYTYYPEAEIERIADSCRQWAFHIESHPHLHFVGYSWASEANKHLVVLVKELDVNRNEILTDGGVMFYKGRIII